MTKPIKYTCPSCGSHEIEAFYEDVEVTVPVVGFGPCMEIQYGEAKIDDPGDVRYQCEGCGNHICSGDEDDLMDMLGYSNPNEELTAREAEKEKEEE